MNESPVLGSRIIQFDWFFADGLIMHAAKLSGFMLHDTEDRYLARHYYLVPSISAPYTLFYVKRLTF